MTDSTAETQRRQVTFDLDDLYRDLGEARADVERATDRVVKLEATIALIEDRLGVSSRNAEKPWGIVSPMPKGRPTHRAMLLAVLADAERPLGVRELMDAVLARFGEQIPRTSVSPLLRKLARKGEVLHSAEDAKWKIGRIDRAAVDGEVVKFSALLRAKREVV